MAAKVETVKDGSVIVFDGISYLVAAVDLYDDVVDFHLVGWNGSERVERDLPHGSLIEVTSAPVLRCRDCWLDEQEGYGYCPNCEGDLVWSFPAGFEFLEDAS